MLDLQKGKEKRSRQSRREQNQAGGRYTHSELEQIVCRSQPRSIRSARLPCMTTSRLLDASRTESAIMKSSSSLEGSLGVRHGHHDRSHL